MNQRGTKPATQTGSLGEVGRGEGGRKTESESPTGQSKWGCMRWLLVAAALLIALPLLTALYWWITFPNVAKLASENPDSTAFIERAKAEAKDEGAVTWTWVPDSRIAPSLRKAIVVAEDLSFFSHNGFDEHELEAALEDALAGDRVRGASTITQQLAKNLWLSPSQNPLRKIREALLARALEENLSKRRILEIYANVVEFGPNTFGAEAAAQRYFSKSAALLNPDESAQLAASLPASTWFPGADSGRYRGHLRRTKDRVRQVEWLDQLVR